MALAPGTRLGPYEVTAQLGVGGMGEVYRATDTNLKRQVAIKVLPEAVAADAERLARFQREAEVLASLNHPNIAGIYGLERADGQTALVMELVEGPTLADRIAQGAIPVDEALPVAKQIAEALEAAHDQGIIHRDLKPANIKLRPDGTVKVLDFGLAKAMEPASALRASAGQALSMSPTITTPAMTQAGFILGTAAYMSPEQAKGRPADRRSDVWAFGAVLYEMLVGRRAFAGEDVSDTMASVLKADTDWGALPPSVPPRVIAVIRRCLQRDPKQRVADVQDVRLALEGAFDTSPAGGTLTAQPAHATVSRPLWRRAIPFAATALIAAVVVGVAAWVTRSPEPRLVIRAAHALPEGRAFRNVGRNGIAISPDGQRLVYNATGGLYLRTLDALHDRVIAGTEEGLANPVFSPDGQAVAYWQNGQLRRIAVAGGGSVVLAAASNPLGMSWGWNGTILYAQSDGIWQVADSGGEPKLLIKDEASEQLYNPQRLPNSDWVLFSSYDTTAVGEARVEAASSTTGERRLLRAASGSGRYVSTGHLLYASEGVLYAVPFDPDRLEATGGPVSIVEGVRMAFGVPSAWFDVSDTGSLLYAPGLARERGADFSIALADRAGTVTTVGSLRGPYAHTRVSRDGRRLAIDSDDGQEANVWVYELTGTSAIRRLTFGGRNRFPVWSPDGEQVAFQSDREGVPAIFVQRADGTGGVTRLTMPDDGDAHIPESWSPDGKYLSFSTLTGSTYSVWILSVEDGTTTRFGDAESADPTGSVFSPDGRWVAYHARPLGVENGAPDSGVFVEPFPATGTGGRNQAPRVSFDFQPTWSPTNMELFYVPTTASGQLASVRVTNESGLSFGNPDLLPFALTAGRLGGGTRAWDALPDGRFVGLVAGSGDEVSADRPGEVRLVINWFEELKRLVPTD